MMTKVKALLVYLNKEGLPIPILRDSTQKPSVSLTLLVLSSIFVMIGLLSAAVPAFTGVNFWEALAWHVTCAVLYYNRGAKISKDGIELTSNDDDKEVES